MRGNPPCPVPIIRLGSSGGDGLTIGGVGTVLLGALRDAREAFLPALMAR